tara:strand:+ start:782 stop:1639 length:858 start_codon:yes stop_codon:yes gene_type:complete
MFIWLASYPKSGNTFVRSMLAAYFFSKDGKFNFKLLKNIKQFPDLTLFKNLGVDINDKTEVIKNYVKVQEKINKIDGQSLRFVKTHSALISINGYKFTNLKNSLGVIYIVRDPRKVILSYANHNQKNLEQSLGELSKLSVLGGKIYNQDKMLDMIDTHVGSWTSNYNSWKQFKKYDRYLLVKYEDLISDPKNSFLLMFNFIQKLSKKELTLDKSKLENVLKTTSFEYLQKLEDESSFHEAPRTPDKKLIKFFKYGKKNTGKNIPINIGKKLEESFSLEMKELGYL